MRQSAYKDLHIIIIDDEIHHGIPQQLIIRALKLIGLPEEHITKYDCGHAYFSSLKKETEASIRLIYFVDYHLVDEQGSDIIRKIRAEGGNAFIIGWSSDEDQAVKDNFINSGANQFLSKKISRALVENALQAALTFYSRKPEESIEIELESQAILTLSSTQPERSRPHDLQLFTTCSKKKDAATPIVTRTFATKSC